MASLEAKVILGGEATVGKTCIIGRLSNPQFNCTTRPTSICDHTTAKITVDGVSATLQIWDTAGAEQFRVIVPMYFHGAQAVIVAYAVNDIRSFDETDYWFDTVADHIGNQDLPLFLVGNKADLDAAGRVPAKAAMDRAQSQRATFFETSALTSFNIQELFQEVARQVLASHTPTPTGMSNIEAKRKGGSCCNSHRHRDRAT
jgi:small GTP-binding protein